MNTIYDSSRSDALTSLLRDKIDKQNGSISFAEFMNHALYERFLGYYENPDIHFGAKGDFTTSPEISPLFAKCLAKQIKPLASYVENYSLLEIGAGSGRLANDLLLELGNSRDLPHYYYIYETSHTLKNNQQEFLKSTCPQFYSRIIWLDKLPNNFVGIIIANEVLDALPVHCFSVEEDCIYERRVSFKNNEFIWTKSQPISESLSRRAHAIKDLYQLKKGYVSEINLSMEVFIEEIIKSLAQGIILFIDYGYGQSEYYHPERRQGTLTSFYKHKRNNNPLQRPGVQDITAHVDFTRLIEIAARSGCVLEGFTTQAAFLLACGLMDFVAYDEKNLSEIEKIHFHHAIKLLTLPTEMGEIIKVMALSKNIEVDKNSLIGFSLQDRRRDLT